MNSSTPSLTEVRISQVSASWALQNPGYTCLSPPETLETRGGWWLNGNVGETEPAAEKAVYA